jgi:hypothetical protein
MPHKGPLQLDQLHARVVDLSNDARRKLFAETRELGGKIYDFNTHSMIVATERRKGNRPLLGKKVRAPMRPLGGEKKVDGELYQEVSDLFSGLLLTSR